MDEIKPWRGKCGVVLTVPLPNPWRWFSEILVRGKQALAPGIQNTPLRLSLLKCRDIPNLIGLDADSKRGNPKLARACTGAKPSKDPVEMAVGSRSAATSAVRVVEGR
jgi:hypothetical protein